MAFRAAFTAFTSISLSALLLVGCGAEEDEEHETADEAISNFGVPPKPTEVLQVGAKGTFVVGPRNRKNFALYARSGDVIAVRLEKVSGSSSFEPRFSASTPNFAPLLEEKTAPKGLRGGEKAFVAKDTGIYSFVLGATSGESGEARITTRLLENRDAHDVFAPSYCEGAPISTTEIGALAEASREGAVNPDVFLIRPMIPVSDRALYGSYQHALRIGGFAVRKRWRDCDVSRKTPVNCTAWVEATEPPGSDSFGTVYAVSLPSAYEPALGRYVKNGYYLVAARRSDRNDAEDSYVHHLYGSTQRAPTRIAQNTYLWRTQPGDNPGNLLLTNNNLPNIQDGRAWSRRGAGTLDGVVSAHCYWANYTSSAFGDAKGNSTSLNDRERPPVRVRQTEFVDFGTY